MNNASVSAHGPKKENQPRKNRLEAQWPQGGKKNRTDDKRPALLNLRDWFFGFAREIEDKGKDQPKKGSAGNGPKSDPAILRVREGEEDAFVRQGEEAIDEPHQGCCAENDGQHIEVKPLPIAEEKPKDPSDDRAD